MQHMNMVLLPSLSGYYYMGIHDRWIGEAIMDLDGQLEQKYVRVTFLT
jgi:hypothetical protein